MKNALFSFPLLLLVLLGGITNSSNAQDVSALYTYSTGGDLPLEPVMACQDSVFYNSVRVSILSDDADNLYVSLTLPDGMTYVQGSIQVLEASAGLSIIEDDVTGPFYYDFLVTPSNLFVGDYITIQYGRQADCEAVSEQLAGTIFKDKIVFIHNNGFDLEIDADVRSYDLLVPSLSLAGEGAIVTSLGSSVMRTLTITNGGQGELDEFVFYIDDGFGTTTTQLETVGGTVINPSSTNGDTLFYTLSSVEIAEFGDLDVHLENGEQIIVKRTYTVTECNNDSGYQAHWGCGGEICQTTTKLEQSTVIENIVPNIEVSLPNPNDGYCYNGTNSIDGGTEVTQIFEVKNSGNGPATNFELTLKSFQPGSNTGANYFSTAPWVVKDALGTTLGMTTNPLTLQVRGGLGSSCTWADQPTRISQDLTGITIPPGESVFIEVATFVPNYECSNDCETYYHSSWWSFSGEWAYQDQCEMNDYGVTDRSFDNRAHNFADFTVEMPTDLIDMQEFSADVYYSKMYTRVKSSVDGYFELIMDLSNSNLMYNGGPFITAPWGGQLPVTVVGDSIFIRMQNNLSNKSGKVPIELIASCATAGGGQTVGFSHHTKYDNDGDCSGDGLYKNCLESGFQMHCPNPCPRGGATPELFALERITRGNPDYNENHLADNNTLAHPDSINLHRVVNGDTLMGTWNILVHPNIEPLDANNGMP
ncbi:MAG: hypothetical protein V3V14_02270, partial [Saprospiraceae bacterium]